MAYQNYYSIVITNDYTGETKVLRGTTRSELQAKMENQYRIWNERERREQLRRSKEANSTKAKNLTISDKKRIKEFESIISLICSDNYEDYYKSLLNNNKYEEFKTELVEPTIEDVFNDVGVPKKSFTENILKKKQEKRIELESKAQEIFKVRINYYKKELKKEKDKYEKSKSEFIKNQEDNNKKVEKAKKEFENGNVKELENFLFYVLSNSRYPTSFEKDFDLQYKEDIKTLIVSYFLPSEEIVPKIIEHKFVASRNAIDVVEMKRKEFEKFYNDVIYMCCLRTIKESFESDTLNYIDNIVFNGWIKYIDKSTGNNTESCVITIDVSKEKFSQINLSQIDYKECIKGLKGIFAPNILSLTPVVPYLNIDRKDSRFIEAKEVKNIALEGYNLATMPWEDFEYFVRELFDKMFNVNGGEVKVTQASHDGGVDAIAFDDDPIRGGKFVIQAKRYNNVVSVSAVRDLYGTMIHEGATKGILVTTSTYGKEAYEFAKDKPITLIDGSALLGLLNKYGYSNLTIKIDKKFKD